MFALPFTAPSPSGHGFALLGRFLPGSAPVAAAVVATPAAPAQVHADEADDVLEDLAQRVRNVGEW